MINLLLFLTAIACFSIAAAWVAENPGEVTITWFDYQIDTSFAFLLLAALITALTIAGVILFIRRIILAPVHFSQRRQLRAYKRGLTELTYGVAALGAADIKSAEAHTRKAEKVLGRTPLTLLLSAQIARSQGDDQKTRAFMEQMLEHKETEYLAARSLSESASKQQMFPKALAMAERAHKVNPGDEAAITTIASLHIRLGQWQQALAAVDKASRKRQLSGPGAKRLRGLIHLQYAEALLEQHKAETSLAPAKAAFKMLPDFVPAILVLAQSYDANGKTNKAIKLIQAAWKRTPHPELGAAYRGYIARQSAEKRIKLSTALDNMGGNYTGTSWTCEGCGKIADSWEAFCPSCTGFDLLAWK